MRSLILITGAGIVPCGIRDFGVTSLKEIGKDFAMSRVDAALKQEFVPFLNDLAVKDKVS